LGLFSNSNLNIMLIFDIFSIIFLRFVCLISSVVIFYRSFYIHGSFNVRFITIVLLFVLSMGILILSPHFIGLIVGWDGLGVTSFLLVIYYNNVSSLRSGLITIYTNRLGDVAILISLFFIYKSGEMGKYNFLHFIGWVFFIFLILAGLTKRAQMPFSS